MKLYFKLQYLRLCRRLEDLGLYPWLVLAISPFIFGCFILLIEYKTKYASLIVLGILIFNLLSLSQAKHNRFLKMTFSKQDFRKIRLIENLAIAVPFSLAILYIQSNFLFCVPLIIAVILALFQKSERSFYKLPTPFGKNPFEHIVGFRKYWIFILINYCITVIALIVNNFRLGLFSILILSLIVGSFYTWYESFYFINIFNCNAKEFLTRKIKSGIKQSIILAGPICLTLMMHYPDQLLYTIIALIFYVLVVILFIIFKYATYPFKAHLHYLLLLAFCILLPPVLLIGIPFFYNKALSNISSHVKH